MTVRPILKWPDKRLRSVAVRVASVTDETRSQWQDMLDTMYAMPGVGLAAPQIGLGLRLAVVDCDSAGRSPIRLANPVIIAASTDTFPHTEASPCLPGVSAEMARPRRVTVRYLDDTGAEVEREFVDLWSTSVQHQIDHLNGQLFVHRLPDAKRRRLLEASRKHRTAR